ncbi:MAG: hypothetical protein AABW73_02265 [Nanoarchaeota archaeon]
MGDDYNNQEVNNSMNQDGSYPSAPTVGGSKKIVFVIIGTVILLIAAGGFFYWNNLNSSNPGVNPINNLPLKVDSDCPFGTNLPSDFRSDIPLYPNQKILCVTDIRTFENYDSLKNSFFTAAGFIIIESVSDDSAKTVYDWYKLAALDKGWTIGQLGDLTPEYFASMGIQTQNYTLLFNKESESSGGKSPFIGLGISPKGSGSQMVMGYGEGESLGMFDTQSYDGSSQ